VWAGWSAWFSSTGWGENANAAFKIVSQPMIATTPGPMILLFAKYAAANPDKLALKLQWISGATDAGSTITDYFYTPGLTNSGAETFSVNMNQWYDFVIRMTWRPDGTDGYIQLWVYDTAAQQETLAVDVTGRVGFGDYTDEGVPGVSSYDSPYFKNGVYWGYESDSNIYRAYFGPVRLYSGADGKAVVQPRD
jgi:hypothetical protein